MGIFTSRTYFDNVSEGSGNHGWQDEANVLQEADYAQVLMDSGLNSNYLRVSNADAGDEVPVLATIIGIVEVTARNCITPEIIVAVASSAPSDINPICIGMLMNAAIM